MYYREDDSESELEDVLVDVEPIKIPQVKKKAERKKLSDFIDFFVADQDSTIRKKAIEEGCEIPFYNDPGHGKSNLYRTLEKTEYFGKRYVIIYHS